MVTIDRTERIAVGALIGLVAVCLSAAVLCYQARLSAFDVWTNQNARVARLQAASQAASRSGSQTPAMVAPATAFIDAPTSSLAGAQLQTYVAAIADDAQATLVSSAITQPGRDDPPGTIRIDASMDVSSKALQAILYRLESGTPYVFVEALTVRPSSAQRNAEDPLLRVTLGLRALLRKAT